MSGYPPVDQEAYTRSILLNSYLGWRLRSPADPYADPGIVTPHARRQLLKFLADRPDRSFRWLSDNSALLSLPVTPCRSLRDAVDRLTAEHESQHWYRGQSAQYVAVYEGPLPSLGNVRVAFDALMPTYFRAVTTPVPAEWDRAGATQDQPPSAYVVRPLRAMMRSPQDEMGRFVVRFLVDIRMRAIARALSRKSGWLVSHAESEAQSLPGTNLARSHLDLIALAQHYEFGSVMVDVTKSVDVASWFASRRYADGSVIAEARTPGVIYRFDKHQIDEVLRTRFVHRDDSPADAARTFLPQLGLFGLVDISDFPPLIARRPGAQHGGSLFGFENSVLHLMLCEGTAVEAFTFPHGPRDADATGLTKERLCPPGDPALTTFGPEDDHGDAPLSPDELDTFLRGTEVAADEREQLVRLLREGVL